MAPNRSSRLELFVLLRRQRVLALVVLVGVLGGLVGAAYLTVLEVAQAVLWPDNRSALAQVAVLVAVGAAVAVLTKWLGPTGDVELLVDNIHVAGGAEDLRGLRSLLPVSILCVAAGGALGPEAPLVQTSGTMGSWVAGKSGLQLSNRRILTITGMAAAFTVLFGAPLGSAIFALEILHRRGLEYYEALVPALLGSLAGYGVYVALTGVGLRPVFHFGSVTELRAGDLPWALVAGVVGALLAYAFTYLSRTMRRAFRYLPATARPVVGGAVLGVLGLWSTYALTFGEMQIDPLLDQPIATGALAVAALAKLTGTSVTLAAGWRGGFIIPLFFVGAAVGQLVHGLVPGTNGIVLVAAVMAAVNVGVTKTPVGTTLVVTEMAGLALLPTTTVAAIVALLLTSRAGLIHSQRQRETTP